MEVLKGNDNTLNNGNFVLQNQTLATNDGFRNVSKIWYDETLSFDEASEQFGLMRSERVDSMENLFALKFRASENKLVVILPSGREVYPNEHAAKGLCTRLKVPHTFMTMLGGVQSERMNDDGDIEVAIHALTNGMRRLRQMKQVDNIPTFFRTYQDGTLRAVLSDEYATIDNEWLMNVYKQLIPGGRISHYDRSDADTINHNIIIPDTLRQETDSEYGGMVHLVNSEIGTREQESTPSIFRAICMNGCIWGETLGISTSKRHRGNINLDLLALQLQQNLNKQIPLINDGVKLLVATHEWSIPTTVKLQQVFGAIAQFYSPSPKLVLNAMDEWRAYGEESTAFGVIDGLTRAGQSQDVKTWELADSIAGKIVSGGVNNWHRICDRAKTITEQDLSKMLLVNAV